jgi:hypothetical protein
VLSPLKQVSGGAQGCRMTPRGRLPVLATLLRLGNCEERGESGVSD